ncbi:Predicted ferric reductase [Paracoccus tibetensis]|uniref:Predicted ferric reductase n=2 Tax=Paracoccus tibetensis TaxID=336292 RepID=A0A1G5FSB5_9RHOB|nr:Predicted ferric reductase [Paracoccus tibetensis]
MLHPNLLMRRRFPHVAPSRNPCPGVAFGHMPPSTPLPARDAAAPPAAHVRPSDRPLAVRLRAAALLALAALAVALPFAVILAGDPPEARGFTRDFAYALGFAALALAGMQFALTGRLKPLLHPFGADIVVVFHRFLSWGAVGLMLGHFGMFYIWHQDDLGSLSPLTAAPYMTAGRVALGCFVVLIVSSEFRKRLKLDYLWWRRLHVALAVIGFGAAIWHVLGAGHFTGRDETRALWLAVTLVWLLLLAWTRLGRPLRQWFNPWRVTENRDEGSGIRTLVLEPQGRPLRGWRPGQFAWLAVGNSPFGFREHPFTISTAPDRGPQISFSIKPLGDDSKRLSRTPVGARAYVDGPYGVFTIDREIDAEGFVMIAGGVGVTPVIANLRALHARGDPRPVILLYANETWDEVAFRDELSRMSSEMDLRVVHIIAEPPEDWPPEGHLTEAGMIDEALLKRLLPPESRDWPHMMCGPAPMLAAARSALLRMGVPAGRIDSEIFEMV